MDIRVILFWFVADTDAIDGVSGSSCELTHLSTELWKTSRRLSLCDILSCGCASTMLMWRLFMESIFYVSLPYDRLSTKRGNVDDAAVSPSSPHFRLCHVSRVYNAVRDTVADVSWVVKFSLSHANCDIIATSLLLALSCVRLCLDEAWTYAKHTIYITKYMRESKHQCLAEISDDVWEASFSSFDRMWAVSMECELTVTMNQYLVTLLDFFGTSCQFWATLSELSLRVVSVDRYPRLLLLLEWLRWEGVISETEISRQDGFRKDFVQRLSCNSSVNVLKEMVRCLFDRISAVTDKYVCDDQELNEGDIIWTAQVFDIRIHVLI